MAHILSATLVAIALASPSWSAAVDAQAPGQDSGTPRSRATIGGVNILDLSALGLADEQRERVTEVQRDLQRKRWETLGALREQRWRIEDAMRSLDVEDEAMRRAYEAMAKLRKDMFEAEIDARRKLRAILTKEQLERLAQRHKAAAKPAS